MQRTMMICGDVMRDLPRPIDEAINKVLIRNPGFKLVQTTVLKNSEYSCTLLCVFESIDGDITNAENSKEGK